MSFMSVNSTFSKSSEENTSTGTGESCTVRGFPLTPVMTTSSMSLASCAFSDIEIVAAGTATLSASAVDIALREYSATKRKAFDCKKFSFISVSMGLLRRILLRTIHTKAATLGIRYGLFAANVFSATISLQSTYLF